MAKATGRPLIEAGRAPLLYLDANVLLPEYLRTIFLDLADAGLVHVHWGEEVLDEVRRNLVKPRFGLPPAVVDHQLRQWAEAFPAALVTDSQALERRFTGKTDTKDTHVAAGALKLSESVPGQPVVLVTSNLRHFPAVAFAGMAVEPARPGVVLKELLSREPRVPEVLDAMLQRFRNPPLSREDLLDILDASNCGAFAAALAAAWGLKPNDSQRS